MNDIRYIFEKGSKKHYCPSCGKKRFVKYIDLETGNYLPEQYGRCDRESKCGYYLNPYKDGYAKAIWKQEQGNKSNWKPRPMKSMKNMKQNKQLYFIPNEILKRTLTGYENNTFIQNLLTRVAFPFDVHDVESVVSLYRLGTVQNGYRKKAITFPFIDNKQNVRAIQVKQFNEENHTTGTDFLHSIIEKHHTKNNEPLPKWLDNYKQNDIKVSCLFGEHLLSKYTYNPVALVEAPKTAIYGTLYFGFPEQPTNLLWLAVYNLSSLNLEKCRALKGRNVYLFPDLSKDGKAFELWSNKAKEIQEQLEGSRFQVSDLLEQLAPQRDKEQGRDIADYLIKQNWQLFRKQNIKDVPKSEPKPIKTPVHEKHEKYDDKKTNLFDDEPEPIIKTEIVNWDNEITDLETYYSNIKLPTKPIKLNTHSTIKDCTLFIKSHLNIVKANNGKQTFLPYLNRLKELKQILTLN